MKSIVAMKLAGWCGAALIALSASGIALAQEKYPSRPIEFVVPWGPGGGADQLARKIAPSLEKELAIVHARVPTISETLSKQVAEIMQTARTLSLSKVPGVAETLDWATALVALNATKVDREVLHETIGCFLKDEADIAAFKAQFDLEHG
jgi:hypothetical protein